MNDTIKLCDRMVSFLTSYLCSRNERLYKRHVACVPRPSHCVWYSNGNVCKKHNKDGARSLCRLLWF